MKRKRRALHLPSPLSAEHVAWAGGVFSRDKPSPPPEQVRMSLAVDGSHNTCAIYFVLDKVWACTLPQRGCTPGGVGLATQRQWLSFGVCLLLQEENNSVLVRITTRDDTAYIHCCVGEDEFAAFGANLDIEGLSSKRKQR